MDPIIHGAHIAANLLGIDVSTFKLLIGAIGLVLLGTSFHRQNYGGVIFAILGWPFIGLFFYLDIPHYAQIGDVVLIIMSAATLPATITLALWEWRKHVKGEVEEALVWLRGAVFWSAMPYLLISKVPYLNAAIVIFTAWCAIIFLRFSGLTNLEMGPLTIDSANGTEVVWSAWEGNRYILTETLGDGGFFVPIVQSNGDPIYIGIILACSALQSMIIFIGAIGALRTAPIKRRIRALLVVLPTIHVLNIFRNAGIIWLHLAYPNWNIFGMSIFDFAHSYAAKGGSLFAMFLIAFVLFDLLPDMHKHVMKLLDPILNAIDSTEKWVKKQLRFT